MDKTLLHHVATLHPNEIMNPYDVIMARHGFDTICTISEQMGGLTIYIPKMRTIFSRCLEKEAAKEYNGFNSAAISQKYGFTERHMRRMLGKK